MKLMYAVALAVGLMTSIGAFETYKEAFAAGQQATKEKKYADAVKNFEEAEKLGANVNEKYNALNQVANNSRTLRKWDDATAAYDKMIGLEGANKNQLSNAKYCKAMVYVWSGKRKDGLESFLANAADAEMLPNHRGKMAIQAGHELMAQKKFDEALTAYQLVTAQENPHPNQLATTYIAISRIQQAKKEYEEAKSTATKAYEVEKAAAVYKAIAMTRQGEILIAEKKTEEAIEALQKVADNDSFPVGNRAGVLNTIGNLYHNLKKYDESFAAFSKILELEKVHNYSKWQAYSGIARFYITTKKFDEAQQAINNAKELKQNAARQQFHLATQQAAVYNGTQKYQETIDNYLEVQKVKGLPAASMDHANLAIGNVYFNHLKDNEKAKEYYELASKSKTGWIKNQANAQLKKINPAN